MALARRQHSAGGRQSLGRRAPVRPKRCSQWVRARQALTAPASAARCGAGRETVADVDIIASAPDAAPVFDHLHRFPLVAEVIGAGESKSSVRLKETDLQVDLRVLPDEDFASALHHFTGSKAHHIRCAASPWSEGLTISEWGVHRMGASGHGAQEGDRQATRAPRRRCPSTRRSRPLRAAGHAAVPPELREDWGEIEAALAHRLPPALVTAEGHRRATCTPTPPGATAGRAEAMATRRRRWASSYLTVTEHSQTAGYAGGLTVERLKAQWEDIDRREREGEGPDAAQGRRERHSRGRLPRLPRRDPRAARRRHRLHPPALRPGRGRDDPACAHGLRQPTPAHLGAPHRPAAAQARAGPACASRRSSTRPRRRAGRHRGQRLPRAHGPRERATSGGPSSEGSSSCSPPMPTRPTSSSGTCPSLSRPPGAAGRRKPTSSTCSTQRTSSMRCADPETPKRRCFAAHRRPREGTVGQDA